MFRRHRPDGALVTDLSPIRRMIPFIMPTRTESVVYYEQLLDLTNTLAFLEGWNRAHPHAPATVFHLILAALGRVLEHRSGLNRFVSGGRIYQRHLTEASFAVKMAFADRAPLKTVKIALRADEPLDQLVERLRDAVGESRSGRDSRTDQETKLLLRAPAPLLRGLIRVARWLDAHNLLPAALIRDDPMFASIFVANLGSVGIDRAWHHLYEYGTISLFCVIGAIGPQLFPQADGQVQVRTGVRLRFSFDERINDGFYCASSLELLRRDVEDPALWAPAQLRPEPPAE
ncbi:MAG: hypothetical protein HYV63_20230 [Candidatus Schekmanbacteria bacterium]|nr:hypothetical protein [Candidatus Schekmanbacteria bacterium]